MQERIQALIPVLFLKPLSCIFVSCMLASPALTWCYCCCFFFFWQTFWKILLRLYTLITDYGYLGVWLLALPEVTVAFFVNTNIEVWPQECRVWCACTHLCWCPFYLLFFTDGQDRESPDLTSCTAQFDVARSMLGKRRRVVFSILSFLPRKLF